MCYGCWLPDWIHFSQVPILKFCQLLSLVLSQVRNEILIYHISFPVFPVQPFRPSIWCSISPGTAALTDHMGGSMQTSAEGRGDFWQVHLSQGLSPPQLSPQWPSSQWCQHQQPASFPGQDLGHPARAELLCWSQNAAPALETLP